MKNYYLKQKVFSIRDSYNVYDENQNLVYYACAKLFSLPRQYKIYRGSDDSLLFTMKRRVFSFMPAYDLFDASGREIANMRKQLAIFSNRIDIQSGDKSYNLEGNIWAHNFTISTPEKTVLNVKKKIISWGDTYEITIEDDSETDKLVAFVVMIDSIYHRRKSK